MTGFGRGEATVENRRWDVEVRCVNHRYLDFKAKLPRGYNELEKKIRSLAEEYHQRGRVDLSLAVSGDFTDLITIKTNMELATSYRKTLQELKATLNIEGEIDLQFLASLPDVLTSVQQSEDVETLWPIIEGAMIQAFESCEEMRLQEGSALVRDLLSRMEVFTGAVDAVEQAIPQLMETRQSNLSSRLEKLLENVQLDPMRLAQEVAIMTDKTDVTEEVVRLRSHIEQFKAILEESGAIGRKLDFLIQEFLREVNTLASKINDAGIAHITVNLKGELEKMREQIQNIE